MNRQDGEHFSPAVSKQSSLAGQAPVSNSLSMANHIETWVVSKLIPYARNPRVHSDAQVAEIAASISEFGFNNPILVDTNAGIIAGAGRLRAAQQLGLEEVPVICVLHDHLSEAQKAEAYVIAVDNQLALNADWDDEILRRKRARGNLQNESFDVSLIGLDDRRRTCAVAGRPGSRRGSDGRRCRPGTAPDARFCNGGPLEPRRAPDARRRCNPDR